MVYRRTYRRKTVARRRPVYKRKPSYKRRPAYRRPVKRVVRKTRVSKVQSSAISQYRANVARQQSVNMNTIAKAVNLLISKELRTTAPAVTKNEAKNE